jgi:hypothetical protein
MSETLGWCGSRWMLSGLFVNAVEVLLLRSATLLKGFLSGNRQAV